MKLRKAGRHLLLWGALTAALPSPSWSQDALLQETLDFTGAITYFGIGSPAYVLAAVRNGETAFAGFGETSPGSGQAPTADTIMRIGSISKAFCGEILAGLVADDVVSFTDPLQDYVGEGVTVPEKDGQPIRLINLITHSAGFGRDVAQTGGTEEDPFGGNTPAAQVAGLSKPLLFTPGTGILYSNYGFDLLGAALAKAAGKPYAELLAERILTPLGMDSTGFNPGPDDQARLMQGHGVDNAPLPFAPTPETWECAGGLYSSANDMLRWMSWHLDRLAIEDAETRLLDHATYLQRDGLDPVVGFDEGGGPMDAMGLGWVVMMPEGDRPLILHKTGGLQGMFAYVAIAPSRGVGVFTAINEFNIGGFATMVSTAVTLITELAPR